LSRRPNAFQVSSADLAMVVNDYRNDVDRIGELCGSRSSS
jgi:hypothetical protein